MGVVGAVVEATRKDGEAVHRGPHLLQLSRLLQTQAGFHLDGVGGGWVDEGGRWWVDEGWR